MLTEQPLIQDDLDGAGAEAPAPRKEARVLRARCRARSGNVNDVQVLDLSATGCLINRRALSLRAGDRALIKLLNLGFLPGMVLWVEADRAGLEFEQPLYEPVLDHLMRGFVMEPLA